MIKIFVITVVSILSIAAAAAGTISIEGRLKSFDSKQVEVESGGWTYFIDKSSLTGSMVKQISQLKRGDKVSFWVPFEGISSAKKN